MKKVLLSFTAALAFVSSEAQTVPRNGFIEEFTSSTCPPCEYFNEFYDPWLVTRNANAPTSKHIVLRYQMNWPNPGNDPCYNPHGNTRKTYYSVTGVPTHFIHGVKGLAFNSPKPDLEAELDANIVGTTNVEITGTYTVKGDSLLMSVTVTPKADIAGSYKLRVAATNDHYTYPGAATDQVEYYHVVRKMFPDAGGTTVTNLKANTPQTFTFADKYVMKTGATPTQGTFQFWLHPYNGHMVAFLQNDVDKAVLQAVSVPAKWATNVNDLNKISGITVYPNPATDQVTLNFQLDKGLSVSVNVYDEVGRVVYTQAEQQMQAGAQTITIPTSKLANGNYFVKLVSEGVAQVERFSVAK